MQATSLLRDKLLLTWFSYAKSCRIITHRSRRLIYQVLGPSPNYGIVRLQQVPRGRCLLQTGPAGRLAFVPLALEQAQLLVDDLRWNPSYMLMQLVILLGRALDFARRGLAALLRGLFQDALV